MRLIKSLGNAGRGIMVAFKREPNFRLQFFAVILVVIAGWFFEISHFEWLSILIISGLVLVLELYNTILEKLLDLLKPRFTDQAGTVKDIAAGAVLIAAVAALLVAVIIFIPRVIERL